MPTSPQQDYANGYSRARDLCLAKGVDAAREWLRHSAQSHAYQDGCRSAIYDYEDANGLAHQSDSVQGI